MCIADTHKRKKKRKKKEKKENQNILKQRGN